MAGRGPAPKDRATRARTNSDPMGLRVLPAVLMAQPQLPAKRTVVVMVDGEPVTKRLAWPSITRQWWQMWADSPLSDDFTSTDWSELLTTALLHAQVHTGGLKYAAELRLRVAKFGATPEDRARLRIQFAAADEAEKPKRSSSSARERRGPLKVAT